MKSICGIFVVVRMPSVFHTITSDDGVFEGLKTSETTKKE